MRGHRVFELLSGPPPPPSPLSTGVASTPPSAVPELTCLDFHLHSSSANVPVPRSSFQTPGRTSSVPSSPSSPTASSSSSLSSSPPSTSLPLGLSTLSTPSGSPVSARAASFSPLSTPTSAAALRPWEGRTFSAQWKAVPVSVLFVHAFTVWESVNIVLSAERLQMEGLYQRRVVLSLRFDELRRCTRDLSKAYKGKRARVLLANADRQWTLDLFEEADAVAFYDLLTRALATVASRRRLLQNGGHDGGEPAGQPLAAEEEAQLAQPAELSGSFSEASDAPVPSASDGEAVEEYSTAVFHLQERILSCVSEAVKPRLEDGDPLSTLLQLFLAVSPYEKEAFDSELLDFRRPFSLLSTPSFTASIPPITPSSRHCAEHPCELPAVSGSAFCARHYWRDELTAARQLDEVDEDALTELRFSFPAANLLAGQILSAEIQLREALSVVLEEYFHPLMQQPSGAEAEQVSLSKHELQSIFAPFERCYALSVSLGRDLQRLSTHSALLPFLSQAVLHHLPDIRAVYGVGFRFHHSIERIQSRMDSRNGSSETGLTLRQWCDQRRAQGTAQGDLLEMMGAPLSHVATYLRLLKAIEVELPAKERRNTDDSPLAPPRHQRLHRDLEDCWQELLAVNRANEAALLRMTEKREMEELRDRFVSLPFPLLTEGRRLIREDEVRLLGHEEGHLFLFTDLLVFAVPEWSKRHSTAVTLPMSPFIREGLEASSGRYTVAMYWSTSVLRVTWWPPYTDASDVHRRSVTLHTATADFDVVFSDSLTGSGDCRPRAGETRDSWCDVWRELSQAGMKEASSAAVLATAQACLDQRGLSSAEFIRIVQPGLQRLCEEALAYLTRLSLSSQLSLVSVYEDSASVSVWSALTAVAITGFAVHDSVEARHTGLQALTVIALLLEAALRPVESGRGREHQKTPVHPLISRALAPLLAPLPRRAELAEALLVVLFLLCCNRTSAVEFALVLTRTSAVALRHQSCQAVCSDVLRTCRGQMECGHLLPALFHVAASASLKTRAWLWQCLSDVACNERGGALALLQPLWGTWPSLVLASMRGVRRPECGCRSTRYSTRVWRCITQVVDALLLALLLYWPAPAFTLHWEGLRKAVEWEWDQDTSQGHLVLQSLLICTLRRVQTHPRLQLPGKATSGPTPAPRQGEGERVAQARLQDNLDAVFYKVLTFVVTAGSRFPPTTSVGPRHRPSLSVQGHVHVYWLHRTAEVQVEMKRPPRMTRPATTDAVMRGARHSVSQPSSALLHRHHRRSLSDVMPNFSSPRADDFLARSEHKSTALKTSEATDHHIHSLLESLVKQRSALALRWQCRRGEDGAVVAWYLADAPLLAHLQATFATHPTLHPISDLWTKIAPDLEQLRWAKRGMTEGEWREVEERHLCALLSAHSAEQRRQADNDLQTDIRGLAGKRLPDWFGDMPRLSLPRAVAMQTSL